MNDQTPVDLVRLARDLGSVFEIVSNDLVERIYLALEQHPVVDQQCIPQMRKEGQGYEIARRGGRLRFWATIDDDFGVSSLSAIAATSAFSVRLVTFLEQRTLEDMNALYESLTPEWIRQWERDQAAEFAATAQAD